jgi:hypothetical protein
MSINDDEWYYGEDNQRWVPKGEASRYMRGDGLDEESNPFRISDDFDVSRVGQSVEPCRCDLLKISKAANELLKRLEERPQIFPTNQNQLDSFAQVGGYAGGTWHKFIDIAGSRFETRDEYGFIKLGSNCAVLGHSCYITKTGEMEFVLDGLAEIFELDSQEIMKTLGTTDDSEVEPEYIREESLDQDIGYSDEESYEEAKMYDDRNFGDLDESTPGFEEDSLPTTPEMWRSSAYSDEKVIEYISALLEPRDIAYMSRFMPPDEVSEWIEKFGIDSLEALHMLNIALGGLHHADDENPDHFDRAVTQLTKDIRSAVKKHFYKYKRAVVIEEQKNREKRENFKD